MNRQITLAAIIFANSLRSARPSRFRKVISLALSVTLVLVPLLVKGRGVSAARPPEEIIIICGGAGAGTPSRIIQECSIAGVNSLALENEVIGDLLTAHQLPVTDKNLLLKWERNLIRAELYSKMLEYVGKASNARSTSEQFFVTKLTELVKQRRILAATKALDEYHRWASNPCAFHAPTGFEYVFPCSCFNHLCGLTGGPAPPSFEEFQNYGASIAYKDFTEKPDLQKVAGDTARNLGILGGFAAVGLAGVIGGAIGASLTAGSAIILAIHPFLVTTIAGITGPVTASAAAGALATSGGVAAGVTGAVSIAAVAAIVVLAIVIGVVQGIAVFTAADIPGKLLEAKNSATNATIDLSQVATTDTGKREIYAEFIQSTMPEFTDTTGVPAAVSTDRQFLLQPGFTVAPLLKYKDWGGTGRSARLSSGWFVDREGSTGAEKLALSINYLNWEGKAWTASRVGNQFLHTRNGDSTATPVKTPEIKYKDWNGVDATARINNAAPTISLTPVTVKQGGTGFLLEQSIGSVSDPDDPSTSLTVTVEGDNPANGVAIGVNRFFGEVSALVTASCEATSTSFTLRVTDPAGASSTGTFNVTVTPNKPPVVAYPSPKSVIVGGSVSNQTLLLPSDPDGGPPSFGTPTVSPAGFTGTVTVDQSGRFQITNASPPGVYSIKVPVSDNCTTLNVGFQLNVTCPIETVGPPSLPGGTVGTPYVQSVSAMSAGDYSFSVTNGSLPLGLSLNPTTGALTGTPNAPGTFSFRVSADSGICSGFRDYTIVVGCQAISIATSSMSAGTVGTSYSQPIDVTPSGNYAFSVVGGSLPSGVSLNPATGVISGWTSMAGSYNFTIKAQTPNGCNATKTLLLAINCPTLTFGPSSLPNGQKGTPYNQTVNATPVVGSNSYSYTGNLPPGLWLNTNTGVLSGTPTTNGTFSFTLTATGQGGCTGSKPYTVTIAPAPCPTVTLQDFEGGKVGQVYTKYATPSPAGSYTYSLMGMLPPGLTFYPAMGLIYGYPTAAGTFNFTITATSTNNCVGTRDYAVTIGQ